jgi:tRNA pseudouridine32 synthase/23S rRNA pseudouridine746 synthase
MVCGMSSSNASNWLRNGVSPSTVGIPANTQLCAIDFLSQKFPGIQRSVWQQRFDTGQVFNAKGHRISGDQGLRGESHLLYFRHLEGEPTFPFTAQIIFQDDELVVADKPHFMPVTPGGKYVQQSLLVQLKLQLNLPELSPIHRIDRETAGLVMFSARLQNRNAYQELFRRRQIEKIYEAIACAPESLSKKLAFPLTHRSTMVEDAQFFRMRELASVDGTTADSFNSETWIDCIERLDAGFFDLQTRSATKHSLARYLLKPVTGQRHQLRVHMNALGLPLVGDQFYPVVKRGADEADDFSAPLQLLARTIAFKDPLTGASRTFETRQQLLLTSG